MALDEVFLFGRQLFVMMFYTTICGWMLVYFIKMIMGDFNGLSTEQVSAEFNNMLANPLIQVGFMFIDCLYRFLGLFQRLTNGVEKISKYMMIALLAIMLVLAVRSVTLNGAVEGIKFYLLPDFSKMIDSGFGEVVFAAMGQAFFYFESGNWSYCDFWKLY